MKGSFLIAEFLATPWAMMPERLRAFAGLLARWSAQAPRAMDDESPQAGPVAARNLPRRAAGSIAVLPLYGAVVQRANLATDICGGTSTQGFAQAFREAMADDSVGSILIDIDSPGGSVYGVSELFNEIYQARSVKPVVAIANSLAASAAYWVGCAASEFYVTPGGEVGSVGVWQAHEDVSEAMNESGTKVTLISAGKYKTEGNPFEPLSDEARTFMQSRVQDYYGAFVSAVAKGRGVSPAVVRDGMGQGRVLGADAALAEKMVDGVLTFDQVVARMQGNSKPVRRGASRLAQATRELDLLA